MDPPPPVIVFMHSWLPVCGHRLVCVNQLFYLSFLFFVCVCVCVRESFSACVGGNVDVGGWMSIAV